MKNQNQSLIFPAAKKTLLQLLGPSIIFVALSLNGGELLLWPHLVANYGFAILWPIPIILILQFSVNIEIERYTLVTGKSTEQSMVNHSVFLSIILAITVLAALVWPAWITTAGNLIAITVTNQAEGSRNLGLLISIALLLIVLVIFFKGKTYQLLEKISKLGLILAVGIICFIVVLKFDFTSFISGIKGFLAFGYIPADISKLTFVGALAYGGVAGVLNLVQSEWIKEKGYGINQDNLDSKKIDYSLPESQLNYRKWFWLINKEHFLLFVVANIFSIFLLVYLGHLLVPLGTAQGFDVLIAEINALNSHIPYLGMLFALSAIIIFIMANIAILDAIGRLIYRLLVPIKNLSWLKSNMISFYATIAGIMILLLSIVIPDFKQPFFLLVMSAFLSALSMWLYPLLLLRLNHSLPKSYRPSAIRSMLIILTTLFYGSITLWALSAYLPIWSIAIIGIAVSLYHIKVLFSIRNYYA